MAVWITILGNVWELQRGCLMVATLTDRKIRVATSETLNNRAVDEEQKDRKELK